MAKHDQPNGTEHKRSGSKSSRKNAEMRPTSPTKFPAPTPEARPKASPRKRGRKEKKEKKSTESAKATSRALQDALHEATPSVADSAADTEDIEDEATHAIADAAAAAAAAVEDEAIEAVEKAAVNGVLETNGVSDPKATITITSEEQEDGTIDATRTKVSIELPSGANGVPESPEQALKDAKAIIQEAKELQSTDAPVASPKRSTKKRKAEELEVENSEEEVVTEIIQDGNTPAANGDGFNLTGEKHVQFGERTTEPPTKRTRVMVPADEFRKQKMQKRALIGMTATVAVGAMIPFVSNLF